MYMNIHTKVRVITVNGEWYAWSAESKTYYILMMVDANAFISLLENSLAFRHVRVIYIYIYIAITTQKTDRLLLYIVFCW